MLTYLSLECLQRVRILQFLSVVLHFLNWFKENLIERLEKKKKIKQTMFDKNVCSDSKL